MNKILYLLISILSLSAHINAQDTLRIANYNIRNGMGLDKRCNYKRTSEILTKSNPHIIAIQEADSCTRRSKGAYVLGEIASLCGMRAYYAPAIEYDGGKYGIGIICGDKPLNVQQHALPGREEKRTIIVAEFERYIFCCTHLSLTSEDRMQSLYIIDSIAEMATKPFIVAGDFNETPDGKFYDLLTEKWEILSDITAPTYPANSPTKTIDYIAVFRKYADCIKLQSSRVVDEPTASDHCPLEVVITIR